jgi:hypothetical protein
MTPVSVTITAKDRQGLTVATIRATGSKVFIKAETDRLLEETENASFAEARRIDLFTGISRAEPPIYTARLPWVEAAP